MKIDHLPQLIGIVNVSGDSFSEGSRSSSGDGAERALQLLADGADIVEFGAESTRPGAADIGLQEEMDRLFPVLEKFRQYGGCRFAVDTRRAETAAGALALGAEYISDVSMGRFDENMFRTVAGTDAAIVICHSRGTPQTMQQREFLEYSGDPVKAVIAELQAAVQKAVCCGIKETNIIVDPGFGFSKTVPQLLELARRIGEFKVFGKVYVGVSRKSFIGMLTGREKAVDRIGGTLAVEMFLAAKGVDYIRTHAPGALRDALKMSMELSR